MIGLTLAFTKLSVTNSSNRVKLLGVGPYERRKRTHALDGGVANCALVATVEIIKNSDLFFY